MKRIFIIPCMAMLTSVLWSQSVPKDSPSIITLDYENNYTPTYYEVIEKYQKLDQHYAKAKLMEYGPTNSGKPLHLFVISGDKDFDPVSLKQKGKTIFLINNGIHPGEPEGIDASLQLADDILRNKKGMIKWLDNVVICIIPVYNIGGALNRSAFHRSGQTTPYECGFRGNAKYLDLNRDFIKTDSENAKAFIAIFQTWQPDVLLDTHTTNGSDHQHVITLVRTLPDALPAPMRNFFREKMLPFLYEEMDKGEYPMVPYVMYDNQKPENGITGYNDAPRYSTGYGRLFHTYSFMTENHIYKPFPDRVKSVYQLQTVIVRFMNEKTREIRETREKAVQETLNAQDYVIQYTMDTTRFDQITFHGYEMDPNQVSPITGLPRSGWDKKKPFTKTVKHYEYFNPEKTLIKPRYYLLPQAWTEAVERLKMNRVEMFRLPKDTTLEAEVYYIDDISHPERPYNGHFFHEDVKIHKEMQQIKYYEGDYVIPAKQPGIKYIMEVLEPEARDSYMRWNFFDNLLDTREYLIPYGFEENAKKYFEEHPEFKARFEQKRKDDPEFAKNHYVQLRYIYDHTEWKEESHKRYPVARIHYELNLHEF